MCCEFLLEPRELGFVWEFSVPEEVSDLFEVRFGCKFVDVNPSIPEDSLLAVDECDRTLRNNNPFQTFLDLSCYQSHHRTVEMVLPIARILVLVKEYQATERDIASFNFYYRRLGKPFSTPSH